MTSVDRLHGHASSGELLLPLQAPNLDELDSDAAQKPLAVAGARVERAAGLSLFLSDGKRLLDAVSGTFNLPLGYNHPEIVAAVTEQLGRAAYLSSDLVGPEADGLLQDLLSHAPAGIGAGWLRDVTGSTAIECAVRIAQKHRGASDVITLFYSHHGQTLFATAISSNSLRRQAFPVATSQISVRVPAPYCRRCFYAATHPGCGLLCVERIPDILEHCSSGRVACLLIEPVLGNGGNIVPPAGYFEALGRLCRERGILIVADEVQTGIGRTGAMFASSSLGLQPDILVTAKGLGGIGLPIAAVLMRSDLDVLERYEHSFTSGGSLLGLAAARATLRIVGEPAFLAEVRRKGQLLGRYLQRLRRFRSVVDIRGVGLMWGIELADVQGRPDSAKANQLVRVAKSEGLVIRSSRYGTGNVVKVRPALIATDQELAEIVDRLETSLRQVDGEPAHDA